MKEIRIRIPTPADIFSSEFGKHLLRASREFFLALATIPQEWARRIEEYEKRMERKEKEGK